MEFCSTAKKNQIMKYACKWKRLEKIYTGWVYPGPDGQNLHTTSYMGISASIH